MSKKSSSNNNLLGVLAFVSLILSAICTLIVLINKTELITIGGQIPSILSLIAYICLVIVVIFAGWSYARGCSKTVQIIFIVIVVLVILGAFGLAPIKLV